MSVPPVRQVMRISLGDKTDFLHVDCRIIYDCHRKGGTDLQHYFDFKVQWEADWVAKAMAGQPNLPYPLPSSIKDESFSWTVQDRAVPSMSLLHKNFRNISFAIFAWSLANCQQNNPVMPSRGHLPYRVAALLSIISKGRDFHRLIWQLPSPKQQRRLWMNSKEKPWTSAPHRQHRLAPSRKSPQSCARSPQSWILIVCVVPARPNPMTFHPSRQRLRMIWKRTWSR